MIKTKEQLFSKFKRKTVVVELPNGEGQMELSELSVRDKADYLDYYKKHKENQIYVLAFVICRSCSFLADNDVGTVLDNMDSETISFLSSEVLKISGMAEDSAEDAEKN